MYSTTEGQRIDAARSAARLPGMRVPAVSFALLSSLVLAQSPINATLVANTPMSVATTVWPAPPVTTTLPAGPLLTNGSLQSAGPFPRSSLSWTVPSSTFVGCELNSSQHPTGSLTCQCDADLTLSVAGPAGTRGHVQISARCSGDLITPGDLLVDVNDDGSFEANSLGWISGFMGPSFVREWDVPVVLGANPLPIRVQHHVFAMPTQAYTLMIRFVPWSPRATDLGSSCGVSEVGWHFEGVVWPVNQPYFLSAQLFPGSGKDRVVARGYGTFGAFVFSERSTRLPIGMLSLGSGCDDLLSAPLVVIATAPTTAGEWQFEVPPLPNGYRLFAQHFSVGTSTIAPTLRCGVTNVVQLQY